MKHVLVMLLPVVLDLTLLAVVAGLTSLYFGVYAHTVEDPIALLGIIPADVAFVVFGLALFGLGKLRHVSLLNRVLPFIAVPGFTVPGLIFGPVLSGPGTTWEPAYLLGGVFGLVLSVLMLVGAAASLLPPTRRPKPG